MLSKPITDVFYVMTFGKYKGCTLAEIFDREPGYLKWLHNATTKVTLSEALYSQVLDEMVVQTSSKYEKVKKTMADAAQKPKIVEADDDDDLPF